MQTRRHEDTKILKGLAINSPLAPETETLAAQIVDAAYRVHSALGPGLMESVYEACMSHELATRRVPFKKQVAFPITYDGFRLDAGLRLDLLVADKIIVELKAVEAMLPLFESQLLTYLKLTGLRLGILVNFNVPLIKSGIKRIIV